MEGNALATKLNSTYLKPMPSLRELAVLRGLLPSQEGATFKINEADLVIAFGTVGDRRR
jgi:hypothetical protein